MNATRTHTHTQHARLLVAQHKLTNNKACALCFKRPNLPLQPPTTTTRAHSKLFAFKVSCFTVLNECVCWWLLLLFDQSLLVAAQSCTRRANCTSTLCVSLSLSLCVVASTAAQLLSFCCLNDDDDASKQASNKT